MAPWYMETMTKTCGPYPGAGFSHCFHVPGGHFGYLFFDPQPYPTTLDPFFLFGAE